MTKKTITMKNKTLNQRLIDSILSATNNFSDTTLDKKILLEISNELVEYVLEVDRNETDDRNASISLENDLYKKFN